MATKKTPAKATETEEQLQVLPAEEEPEKAGNDNILARQQAEIDRLKAQLEAAQRKPAGRSPQSDAEVVKKAAQACAESGTDPWSVTVNIRSPRRPRNEDPFYWLNVNGRSVQIPADDRYYDIKLPWAEALINSLDAERYAADFQDKMEVYDPVTNPHRD